jgi:hypothetical protein
VLLGSVLSATFRFLSSDGVAEISDFMTLGDLDAGSRLVRRVKAVRRSIHFRMRCMPRFDYARLDHKICAESGTVIFTGSGCESTSFRVVHQPCRPAEDETMLDCLGAVGTTASAFRSSIPGKPSAIEFGLNQSPVSKLREVNTPPPERRWPRITAQSRIGPPVADSRQI